MNGVPYGISFYLGCYNFGHLGHEEMIPTRYVEFFARLFPFVTQRPQAAKFGLDSALIITTYYSDVMSSAAISDM